MRKRGSITYQVQQELLGQLRVGSSKHGAKIEEGTKAPEGIFSYGTLETYLRQASVFAKWAKKEHACRSISDAKPYIAEYLQAGIDRGLSAATLSTQRAAICKLYHLSASDVDIKLPERNRADITRSRNSTTNDRHFSLTNNAGIIDFCRATGLRRHELAALRRNQICVRRDGTVHLRDVKGKGGKVRNVDVVPGMEDAVAKYADAASDKRVFPKVPQNMDVHSYRREYVSSVYAAHQRHLERTEGRIFSKLPNRDLYYCRRDKAGTVYDKKVMAYVSRQLGHNRIGIIAGHYLD